jgi:hypothetical protein
MLHVASLGTAFIQINQVGLLGHLVLRQPDVNSSIVRVRSRRWQLCGGGLSMINVPVMFHGKNYTQANCAGAIGCSPHGGMNSVPAWRAGRRLAEGMRRTTDLPTPCGPMPRLCHGSGRSFSHSSRGLPSFGARAHRTRPLRKFCVPPMCRFRARLSPGFAGASCTGPIHGSSAVLLPETRHLNPSALPCRP